MYVRYVVRLCAYVGGEGPYVCVLCIHAYASLNGHLCAYIYMSCVHHALLSSVHTIVYVCSCSCVSCVELYVVRSCIYCVFECMWCIHACVMHLCVWVYVYVVHSGIRMYVVRLCAYVYICAIDCNRLNATGAAQVASPSQMAVTSQLICNDP